MYMGTPRKIILIQERCDLSSPKIILLPPNPKSPPTIFFLLWMSYEERLKLFRGGRKLLLTIILDPLPCAN